MAESNPVVCRPVRADPGAPSSTGRFPGAPWPDPIGLPSWAVCFASSG